LYDQSNPIQYFQRVHKTLDPSYYTTCLITHKYKEEEEEEGNDIISRSAIK